MGEYQNVEIKMVDNSQRVVTYYYAVEDYGVYVARYQVKVSDVWCNWASASDMKSPQVAMNKLKGHLEDITISALKQPNFSHLTGL